MSSQSLRGGLGSRSYWALMAAQFLDGLNANILRFVVGMLLLQHMDLGREARVHSLAAVMAAFALPYLLFSTLAGNLADRFSKRLVVIWTKVIEICVVCLAAAALWSARPWLCMAAVFLMGVQATLFNPAKYGMLPEILDDQRLSRGNGLLEMFSNLAIILGGVAGSLLMAPFNARLVGATLIAIALVGTVASLFVAKVPAADPARKLGWNFAGEAWANFRLVRADRALFLSILGVSYFWLMGALFQMNFTLYGLDLLRLDEKYVGLLLAAGGVGIGAGAVLAGWLSGEKIEFGLVPIGAAVMAAFSVDLFFAHRSAHAAARTGIDVFMLGIGSGLYLVPLQSFVQQRAPADSKGRVLSITNFLTFAAIILAAGLYAWAGTRWDPAWVYLFLALLTVGVTAYIFTLLPDFLLRFLLWSTAHAFYRIRVVGSERVPKNGGALLVCNHVSYLDALLVLACIQRFVRFIMYRKFYDVPVVNWGARKLRVIPISESDPPRKMIQSLRDAAALIREGELVCIFAEGMITRTGNLLRFQRGFERVMKGLDAPIIPVHIDRMWGSLFSFEGGRAIWKVPSVRRSKVTVSFGAPLPATSSAAKVRQAVSELGAEAFALRKPDQVLLHEAFIASARSTPGRLCMADTTGASLSYRAALWKAVALADYFKRKAVPGSQLPVASEPVASAQDLQPSVSGPKPKAQSPKPSGMVAVCLPTTAAGALANVALLLAGKVPVNLNYTAGREALGSALRQCGIRTLVTSRAFIEKVRLAGLERFSGGAAVSVLYLEDVRGEIGPLRRVWAALKAEFLPRFLLGWLYGARGRCSDDLCTVIFSSGSTGEPKGVMLSHANVMSDLEGMSQVFGTGSRDRIAGVLPFFHSLGFTATLWLPLAKRIGVVYHPNPVEGRAIGAMVREYGCTALLATPTFLRIYTRTVFEGDFGSLKTVVTGAEKLRTEVADAFFEKFSIRPVEGYGCTECSPVVSLNIPDFRSRGIVQKGTKRGSIGQAIPGVTVRVVDPNAVGGGRLEVAGAEPAGSSPQPPTFNPQPLPLGSDGMLLVKGANVMRGYLGKPELTAEVIRDGWYVTGDVARLDEDGFITITDRLSRFSKIGGEMVPHGRVEETIEAVVSCQLPVASGKSLTTDNRQLATSPVVAVTSVPDEKKGERLAVLHTRLPMSVEDLCAKLNETDLPKLWIPRKDDFFEVETIPVLGTGKVDLRGVKKLAGEKAGASTAEGAESR
ncbi:MAG TPA: MFS transporter [Planctomycetota bacterium]|nr:MFS transporter [Planctomycetota bacterium]